MNLSKIRTVGGRIWYTLNDRRYRKLTPLLIKECISNLEKWQPEKEKIRRIPGVNLNTIINPSNWGNSEWLDCLKDMGEPLDFMHRKLWEYAQTLYGFKKLGVIKEDSTALGVACGHEPVIFYLANNIALVYATDIYKGQFYQKSGGFADPSMLTTPEKFSPFPFKQEHLKVMRMDARKLEFPDETFDLIFCLSSIEHFGNYSKRLEGVHEIARVLKKGGIAAITTELILNNVKDKRYFDYDELKKLIAESGMKAVEKISFDIERIWFEKISMHPMEEHLTPYFILQQGKTIFTSVMIFLEK
ncbi:MAG: class I SAM-dependent methyltransferase [Firmicutes bacterium]|nr:class I SAM-dependent methyltransferase [Bacillota bacterium]